MNHHATTTEILDLTAIPLAELFGADDDSALAHAARRVARRVGKKEDPLAAFTSYVE